MNKPPADSGRKPNALFLSPEAPYPAIGGGPLRSASLLEYLARHFSVHAILFRQPGDPDPARAIPPARIDKLDVLPLPYHSKHPLARALRNSGRIIRNTPPLLDRFSHFSGAIAALVRANQYEVAVVEHFWCAPYLEQLRPRARRVILDLHNIESVWYSRLAASESAARALFLRRFATGSVALERKWLPGFDHLLVASAADAAQVRDIAPGAALTVYPNALPEIAAPERAEREQIVFSGNLEYPPNIAAIRFFVERVWPLLAARWPDLRWSIVGRNPESIAHLVRRDARIQIAGSVPDAVAALAQARVAVVPVHAGSGTRVKILEAWAAGTAVVSTTLGAEGLECRDGEHLILADEPSRFADAVSRLLASPAERGLIGAAGRRLYEESYTWQAAWRSLDTIFGN